MARYMDVSRTLSASSAVCATASAAVVRRRCHFVMLQQHKGGKFQLESESKQPHAWRSAGPCLPSRGRAEAPAQPWCPAAAML